MKILKYIKDGDKKLKIEKQEILIFKKKPKDAKISGYARLSSKKIPNKVIFEVKDLLERNIYVTEKKKGRIIGYILLEDGTYVGVYKYPFIFIIILSAIVAIGAYGAIIILLSFITDKPIQDFLPVDPGTIFDNKLGGDAEKEKKEIINNDKGIDFPIYSIKTFNVNKKSPNINLGNPSTNILYFQYFILDGDKEVYKTGLIEPGKMHVWNAVNSLKPGEYDLRIQIKTFTKKNQTPANGFNSKINIVVE